MIADIAYCKGHYRGILDTYNTFCKYKHKKSGHIYSCVTRAINATNANDGQKMIVYYNPENKMWFVREESEFFKKFEKLKNNG